MLDWLFIGGGIQGDKVGLLPASSHLSPFPLWLHTLI